MKKLRSMPLFATAMALLILFGVLTLLLPRRTFSELENRTLSRGVGAAVTDPAFGEKAERFLSDHFPGRDALVQLHALWTTWLGQTRQDGILYGANGRLLEEPVGTVTATARTAVDTLEEMQQLTGLPVYLTLIPTSAMVCGDALPHLYQAADQQQVIIGIHALCNGVIPLSSGLDAADEGMYYRTDHHLTADGAWVVYASVCRVWGLTPASGERVQADGFLGSYYARIPSPAIHTETMTVEIPSGLTLTVDGAAMPSFVRQEALGGRNKYAAVIGETYAHAVITGGTGGENLLVIGDSYANAVVPLLAQHFARVDVIDPRYFGGDVAALMRETGSSRVLVLYGLNTFSTNRGLALLTLGEE